MAGMREDYVLRGIDRLRVLVAGLLNPPRASAKIDEALQLALELQTKLFPIDAGSFLAMPPAAQFDRLRLKLSEEEAAEKCATYAELLFHTATLYDFSDRHDLASGARQLSLHIALLTEQAFGSEDAHRLAALLASGVSRRELAVPVRQLLEDFEKREKRRR